MGVHERTRERGDRVGRRGRDVGRDRAIGIDDPVSVGRIGRSRAVVERGEHPRDDLGGGQATGTSDHTSAATADAIAVAWLVPSPENGAPSGPIDAMFTPGADIVR